MTSSTSHSDLGDGDNCFFGKITAEEAKEILFKGMLLLMKIAAMLFLL